MYFNEEHNALRDMVKKFVDKEINPKVDEWEESNVPLHELFKKMGDLGLLGITYDEKWGGQGLATHKALEHAGITSDQIDRVEFNEAFASQVMPSIKELGISEDKINVNGGSLGIGHPIGATGARLVMTVAKELRRSKKRYGLATQCIGAGMGISTIPSEAPENGLRVRYKEGSAIAFGETTPLFGAK